MGNTNKGWRVLDIFPNGPAHELDINVFFEFVVGVDGHRLDMSRPNYFMHQLQALKGKEVNLTLYNYKSGTTKWVTIVPSDDWGGQGLLGLQLSNDSFEIKDENVIKVRKVTPNSPAAKAGFLVDDFIIATTLRKIEDVDVFKIIINQYAGKTVEFWVYRADTCQIRKIVMVMPEAPPMGLEVAEGIVNQIPPPEKPITMAGRKPVAATQVQEMNKEPVNQIKQNVETAAYSPEQLQQQQAPIQPQQEAPLSQPIQPTTFTQNVQTGQSNINAVNYQMNQMQVQPNINTVNAVPTTAPITTRTTNTSPRDPVPVSQYAMPRIGSPK